jgi:hypothetical protein
LKRTALKRKPWRRALGDTELWAQFKFMVAQADDFTCAMVGRSACDGPLQSCHVIQKSKLRDRGYGAETIYSVDAAFTACRRHHTRHDSYLERIPDSLIPERCLKFANRIAAERSTRETA